MNDSTHVPNLPPVVFIVFNRPGCTEQSLSAIRAARPARLYVVADGPRPDRPGEAERCAEARAVVEHGVDWPCEVIRDYAPSNLGLARRVSSGLNAVFAQETEAIILEDDCVADPAFFRFCAELLERYREVAQVGQISGTNSQGEDDGRPGSYYFSQYPHCWGWATWRRAWQEYDHAMSVWSPAKLEIWMYERGFVTAERQYWQRSFQATAGGQVDSWAYRWTLTLWKNGWTSVSPRHSLVANIGFGPDATNTRDALAGDISRPATTAFPLTHPDSLEIDAQADARTSRQVFQVPSVMTRVRRRLRRWFA